MLPRLRKDVNTDQLASISCCRYGAVGALLNLYICKEKTVCCFVFTEILAILQSRKIIVLVELAERVGQINHEVAALQVQNQKREARSQP